MSVYDALSFFEAGALTIAMAWLVTNFKRSGERDAVMVWIIVALMFILLDCAQLLVDI